ncbi:pyruvate, phosphate dikinase [Patulibacter sp. NPDC049589]|uniref:pyruvate, phosphate dikinase n=1 Tax=Patulibacter sp. NPDC049589 TaxID=3154731 RepID=UPI00341AB04A
MTRPDTGAAPIETAARYVFAVGSGVAPEPRVLGGKGAGLVRLVGLGLPVPPAFVVSCEAGLDYLAQGELSAVASREIHENLVALEVTSGREFGNPERPLLVSVRSGAPVSMPGMMDTVLNVGLTATTVEGLVRETGDPRFAWNCYARFAESYARIVRGLAAHEVESALLDLELSGLTGEERSRAAVAAMQELMIADGGRPVPDDPRQQILEATEAVFRSWNSERAQAYRRLRRIDGGLGTATVVQVMVFGNRGATSGSGVAFTRDPSTGEARPYGDFLFDAQGEDVVDGTVDPASLEDLAAGLPEVHAELVASLARVEEHYRDVCEVEFTVDERELWVLQTRVGQRSGRAALKAAVSFVDEGLIDVAEALGRVTPAQVEAAAAPRFAAAPPDDDVIMRGLGASPGAAVGRAVFDVEDAVTLAGEGHSVVLVRPTTSPSDVRGFIAASAIVTGRGGRTSHAAVVARGMARPAVCGVGAVSVSADGTTATIDGITVERGSIVSVDGVHGTVARGAQPLVPSEDESEIARFLAWAAADSDVPVTAAPLPAEPDGVFATTAGPVVVLDDADHMSEQAANARIQELNAGGEVPAVIVSAAWARRAEDVLRGTCRGLGSSDQVVSLPLLGRGLRAR